MTRLLILSCSQRKRSDPGLLPAIERYDGPAFRVLRKYVRCSDAEPPVTYILSAAHGLLAADTSIPYYDAELTPSRAIELRPEVHRTLNRITKAADHSFDDVFVCASRSYLSALGLASPADIEAVPTVLRSARCTEGSIGGQVAQLRDWLYGAPPPPPDVDARSERPVIFRGVELYLSTGEVLQMATDAARTDPAGAARFEAWYVPIGEKQVAPKWLVQVLTGIPVSEFRTSDARRVLARLGVEVIRV